MTKASALKKEYNAYGMEWNKNKLYLTHSIVTHDCLSKRKNNKQMFHCSRGAKYYDSFVMVTILLLTLRHYDRQTKITISVFSGNKPSLLVENVALSLNCADVWFLHPTDTNIVFHAKLCHLNKFSHIQGS
jgi:hypothetical protein